MVDYTEVLWRRLEENEKLLVPTFTVCEETRTSINYCKTLEKIRAILKDESKTPSQILMEIKSILDGQET